MKKIFITLVLLFTVFIAIAHDAVSSNPNKIKIGWFVSPEYSTMFLTGHNGLAVGFLMGIKLFKGHLKVGYFNYGRSGPINRYTVNTKLPTGVTYKGKSSIDLRADYGAFGLMIAPSFTLPKSNVEIDFPVNIGSIGAGFYLAGNDRKTPDGRRVSEWENELFEGKDAAFA